MKRNILVLLMGFMSRRVKNVTVLILKTMIMGAIKMLMIIIIMRWVLIHIHKSDSIFSLCFLQLVRDCCAAPPDKKRKKRSTTDLTTTFGGFEYTFSLSDSAGTWDDAQAKCSESQENLASIPSREVHDYLISISQTAQLAAPVWIGGSDSINEGVIKWIDNEAFSFNEPLVPGTNQEDKDCLAFSESSGTGGFTYIYLWKFKIIILI